MTNARGDAHDPHEETLRRWAQWVAEVERGHLHTEDEWLSVYWTRDDLEDALHRLPPETVWRLVEKVDLLDERFRRSTVASDAMFGKAPEGPGRWWWGRVPRKNGPRVFLLRSDMPRPEPR